MIERHAPDRKKLPFSLRELFNHLRETADGGGPVSHVEYAEHLNEAWLGPRYGVDRITTSIFDTTEDGENNLTYWMIEAYARQLRVPSALLLLVSRIGAELASPDDGPRKAAEILIRMRKAIDALEAHVTTSPTDGRSIFQSYLQPILASDDIPVARGADPNLGTGV